MSLLWMLPLQGAWYTCVTAVMVMSDTAGLDKAKGTLIHCGDDDTQQLETQTLWSDGMKMDEVRL